MTREEALENVAKAARELFGTSNPETTRIRIGNTAGINPTDKLYKALEILDGPQETILAARHRKLLEEIQRLAKNISILSRTDVVVQNEAEDIYNKTAMILSLTKDQYAGENE